MPALNELYERGVTNGVENLKILTGDEAREMEPALSDTVVAALFCPSSGIVCPFELTLALPKTPRKTALNSNSSAACKISAAKTTSIFSKPNRARSKRAPSSTRQVCTPMKFTICCCRTRSPSPRAAANTAYATKTQAIWLIKPSSSCRQSSARAFLSRPPCTAICCSAPPPRISKTARTRPQRRAALHSFWKKPV